MYVHMLVAKARRSGDAGSSGWLPVTHQVSGALQQDDVGVPLDPYVVRTRHAAAVRRVTVAVVHQYLRQAPARLSVANGLPSKS